MKAIGRKAVFIYSGLDVILQITSVDPLEQIYYAGSDSFIPDRTLTPLVLTPRAQVKDKKGLSMPSELANVAWYIGTPDEKNRVTSRTQTDDYYLDGLNLVVRKNLEVPQQIYVKAEYLDTRTKTTITIPQVVQLSISKSSEIAPAPTCSIDRPSDWSINPLKDAAIQDLSATIFKDEKAYRGAVKWNKSFNGIKSEIVEEDDFYLSGQLTNSLKIDTDKLPSGVLIGCENPSEELYNKVYGVNPEWDGRMQEVFENRNLLSLTSLSHDIQPYPGNIGLTLYTLKLEAHTKYTITSTVPDDSASLQNVFFSAKNDAPTSNSSNSVCMNIPLTITTDNTGIATLYLRNLGSKSYKHVVDGTYNIKVELGDKSTPYTPAPEDLNYLNIIYNSNFSDNAYRWSFNDSIFRIATDNSVQISPKEPLSVATGIVNFSSSRNAIHGNLSYAYVLLEIPKDLKLSLFGFTSNRTPSLLKKGLVFLSNLYKISDKNNFRLYFDLSDTEYTKDDIVKIHDIKSLDLTQIFGNGNKFIPTKKQLDEVFESIATQHIESPFNIAPDGIIQGEYSTDVPMFVKYPDTLDISMKPLPLIPEGVEELTLEVEATTSAGTLNNPAKYFDIDYYLSNDEEAGVEPVKVGSGNSVKVTRNQLKERPEYYLEWNYKPRPTTLNKKQSQSMDK